MAFIPAFSEPQSISLAEGHPLSPALGQSRGEARAAGAVRRDTPPPSPTAPGEDWAPSSVQTSFCISTTPKPRRQKSSSPRSTSPRTVWKPQSNGPMADWLGRVERGQPGEKRTRCPDHKSLRISNQGARRARRGNVPRHPERIRPRPRLGHPSISLQLR